MSAPARTPSGETRALRLALLWATLLAAMLSPLLWPTTSTAAVAAATTTTSTSAPGSCEQWPPDAALASATSTSLSFTITHRPPYCGFPTGGTLFLSRTRSFDDAVSVHVEVGQTVTVPGLAANTAYYWLTTGSSPVSSGWLGPARTLASGPTTTTTVTTACDPFPPTISFVSATSTSLTFSYQAFGTAACGGTGPVTIQVSPDRTTTNAVRVSAPWPSGTVTVPNLSPSTSYWYNASGGGSPFGTAWLGPVSTLAGNPVTTTTTTTTTGFCDPLPPELTYVSATTTSLTFTYKSNGAFCHDTDDVIVHIRLPGASTDTATVSAPAQTGTVTVPGLTPGTTYQYGASGGGSPFGTNWYGTATTLPLAVTTTTTTTTTTTGVSERGCLATYQPLSSWPGNFLANLVIENRTQSTTTRWQVTWTWPGGQTLVAAYSGTVGGSGAHPVVSNPSWGGRIAPGGRAETVILGAGTPPASAPSLTCTLL